MQTLIRIVFLLLLFSVQVHAGTYTAYFADNGTDDIVGSWDASECTEGDPCNTLSEAQAVIDDLAVTDTVTLYFAKDDTWTENTDTTTTTVVFGLTVNDDDPAVNIDAFGSGAKPKFYGTVADFSGVPDHNATTGPLKWSRFFQINRDDCSIKNVQIAGVYGHAIMLGDTGDYGDNFTLEACDITNFGSSAIRASSTHSTQGTTITKNLIYNGQQLNLYNKLGSYEIWGSGLSMNPESGTSRAPIDNIISYNIIYNIGGEGIIAYGCTIEYNIFGDTSSVAIYIAARGADATSSTVRYNLVIMSDIASSDYDDSGYTAHDGIGIIDEVSGGSNSSATVEVYGNIVINRNKGIFFTDAANASPWGGIRIYNNTIIDSASDNLVIGIPYNVVLPGQGFIYNNLSIMYEGGGGNHASDWNNPEALSTYWTIDNNHYWTTGGSPTVDADWQTNYIVTDPKLEGEETSAVDWDGQSGATYFKDITFANCVPESDGGGIGNGKDLGGTYQSTLLSTGSDFSVLPGTQTFYLSDQDLLGWIIGAALPGFSISAPTPTSLQTCGFAGTIGVTSSGNADCKWSLKNTDTCATAYADLDTAFSNGQAGTAHTTNVTDTDCDDTNIYVVKCEEAVTDLISNCLEITVDIAAGGGATPQPAPGTIIGGGSLGIVGGGNLLIH